MALACALVVPSGQGQEAVSAAATNAPITLEALVAEALETNPELRFYQAEMEAARAGRRTAGLLAQPELSSSVGHKSLRDSGVSAEGVAWSVSVMQPFEWPGRIGLRKAIANHDIELAALGSQRFRLALASRVRTLAYGLFAAREQSAAATEVAARFKALREVLVQRDPAGLTPLLETRVIEATELTAQHKASEALLAAQTVLLELNQLRGAAPGFPLALEPVQLAFRPLEGKDALVAMARTNNFELRVRTVELFQQGLRVDLARNERFPSLSVGPTFSEERAGDRERIVGVGFSLPLPLWNRNQGNIDAAAARQTQAEVALHIARVEVERKVLQATLAYATKVGQMAAWRPDAIQHFKEAAAVADRHYRLGAVPISTYVELQEKYLEAVESLLETNKEALEAAQQLELLTGLPLPLTSPAKKEAAP